MSNEKKDLTSIEDLGEFIHELHAEDELTQDDPFSPDVPDLPESTDSDLGAGPDDAFSFEASSDDFTTSFEEAATAETFEAVDFKDEGFETSFEDAPDGPFEVNDDVPATASWDADLPLTESTEPKEEPGLEPDPTPQILPEATRVHEYKTPETFEDLKKFSESSSFTGMATEGNPSFSVLIKNVRFIEDVNDIITLLKELNLLMDPEDQVRSRLMRGMLLVPRVSEYAGIFLSHKLRRFDVDIMLGPSDEIHPPKHQETPETGIVSKWTLYQNQNHHFQFDDPKLEISQILISATQILEGHQILRYLGVASEHKIIDSKVVDDENSDEIPRHYQELAQKLKAHALKAHANAVVGLNYQLTPLPSEFGLGDYRYRLSCTGNMVWVNKL